MSGAKRPKNAKECLEKAFLKEFKKHPLSKINVSKLCKSAGVKRSAFYYHFASVRDMLNSIEDDFIEAYNESAVKVWLAYKKGDDDYHKAAELSLKYLYKNQDLLTTILYKNSDWRFVNEWRKNIMKQLSRLFEESDDASIYIAASAVIAFYRFAIMKDIKIEEVNPESLISLISAILKSEPKMMEKAAE